MHDKYLDDILDAVISDEMTESGYYSGHHSLNTEDYDHPKIAILFCCVVKIPFAVLAV